MEKCSVCVTPKHTEKFERIRTAILDELNMRSSRNIDDAEELAMALSVLVAEALSLDIYQ